jgi:F-type H+-transporting ATPase subunit a
MAEHAALQPHHEVQDTTTWHVFHEFLGGMQIELLEIPITSTYSFKLTKFMVLELIAAAVILLIFIPLARRIQSGGLPRGPSWNFFEGMLLFVRDQIARPNLDVHHDHSHEIHLEGKAAPDEFTRSIHDVHSPVHEADKYVPFLWTQFLFILVCNLLGMIPVLGSPTASIWMTGGMALISFLMLHGCVIAKFGVKRYFVSLWPKIDMPPGQGFKIMGYGLTLMIGAIELMGTVIKSGVLAVRLFANMFAGHMVLANILFFIYLVGNLYYAQKTTGNLVLFGGVSLASVAGVVALSLLELFVAFLQAYIFTFLTALFMGMQMHHAEEH